MPKSRSGRSESPHKPLSAQLNERENIFQNVREMFSDTVAADVVHRVLSECNWIGEDAIDKLLTVVEQVSDEKSRQSEFHQIAQGVFGSIRHEDYPNTARSGKGRSGSQDIGSSLLTESQRVIRPPEITRSTEEDPTNHQPAALKSGSSFLLSAPPSPSHLTPGSPVTSEIGDKPGSDGAITHLQYSYAAPSIPIANESEFPPLPLSNASHQSRSLAREVYPDTSRAGRSVEHALYSRYMEQAQTAYYHQDDDASRAQDWEKYKEIMGEHYFHTYASVGNSTMSSGVNDVPIHITTSESKPLYGRTSGATVGHKPVVSNLETDTPKAVHKFPDDPAIINASMDRPRHGSSRSFPVRLLSKSPEGSPEKCPLSRESLDKLPQNIRPVGGKNKFNINYSDTMDSADLDETVLKCISEVNDQLLSEIAQSSDIGRKVVRSRSSSLPLSPGLDVESSSTSCSTPDPFQRQTPTPNNQPMTLPVIGLSVEAPEFVPRAKKKKLEKSAEVSVVLPISEDSKSPISENSKSPISEDNKRPISEDNKRPISEDNKRPISDDCKRKRKVVQQSQPIEVKRNVKNVNIHHTPTTSPNPFVGSPALIGSPNSLGSPICPISPTNPPLLPPNSIHLTGSPMFITPKWGPPVYHNIQSMHQPPPLPTRHLTPVPTPHITHAPRYIGPLSPHNAPYRVQVPPRVPLPSRVMFARTAPPVFRVSGFSPHIPRRPILSHPPPLLSKDIDNMAAIATGQPIMATGKANAAVAPPTVNVKPQSLAEQCVKRTRELQKGGNKVMVIIRGLPGSGKSTLARIVKLDGVILSTDDYFMKGNVYDFNPDRLSDAHQWNRERAKEAIKLGTSPIVIDNTNTQKWEFKPYVNLALNNSYYVDIIEPDTPWRFRVKECARRTVHGIPEEHIARMLERYEFNITTDMLLNKKTTGDKNSDKTEKSEKSKNLQKSGPTNKTSVTKSKKSNTKPTKNVKSEWEASWKEICPPKTKDQTQLMNTESDVTVTDKSMGESKRKTLEEELEMGVKDNSTADRQSVEISPSEADSYLNPFGTERSDSSSKNPLLNVEFIDKAIVSVGSVLNMDKKKSGKGSSKPLIDLTLLNQMSAVNQLKISAESDSSTQDDGSFYSCNSEISAPSSVNASPRSAFTSSIPDKSPSQIKLSDSIPVVTVTSIEKIKITSEMIKEIEDRLSEETLNFVHEILIEHVGKKHLTTEETTKIEEELKALLQFYPIDDEQRISAEQLIGYRLNYSDLKDEQEESEDSVAELAVNHALSNANLLYNDVADIGVHEFLMSEAEPILNPEQAEDTGDAEMCFNMEFENDLHPENRRCDVDVNEFVGNHQSIQSDIISDIFMDISRNLNGNKSVPVENFDSNSSVTEDISQDMVFPDESCSPDNIDNFNMTNMVDVNSSSVSPFLHTNELDLARESPETQVPTDSVNVTSSRLTITPDTLDSPLSSGSEHVKFTTSVENSESCDIEHADSDESDTDDEREFQLLLQNLARHKAMTAQEAEILKSLSEDGESIEIDLLSSEENPLVVRAKDNHFTEVIKKEVNLVLEEFERKFWGDKDDSEEPIETVDTVWSEDSTDIPWNEPEDNQAHLIDTELSPSARPQRKPHKSANKPIGQRQNQQTSCMTNDKEVGDNAQPETNKNTESVEFIKECDNTSEAASLRNVPENETVCVAEVRSVDICQAEIETLTSLSAASSIDGHNVGCERTDPTVNEHCIYEKTTVLEAADGVDVENNTNEEKRVENNQDVATQQQTSLDPVMPSSIINGESYAVGCGQLVKPVASVDTTDSNKMSVSAEMPSCIDTTDEELVLSDDAIFISDDECSAEVTNQAASGLGNAINPPSHPSMFLSDDDHGEYMQTMQAIANMGPIYETSEDGSFGSSELYVDTAMLYDNALLEHDIDNGSLGMLINSYYNVENVDQPILNINNNSAETVAPTANELQEDGTTNSHTQEIPTASVPSITEQTNNEINAQIDVKPHIKPLVEVCNNSTDNTPSSSCNASPNINSTKRKKQSKRKISAKHEGPFLGSVDKERFLSSNWNSLSLSPDQAFASPKSSVINNGRNIEMSASYTTYCNQASQTESGDFRVVNLLSQGEEFEFANEYSFLDGIPRIITLSDGSHKHTGSEHSCTIPKVHKLDQSSSTDDLDLGSDGENIKFLKTCFPNIYESELECVLTNCADNVEWAINLLLDWKYSLHLTEDEKQTFADEVAKVRRCKSPIAVDLPESEKHQPVSLLDSCFKFIEKEKIASREEIEQQLIQTGKERLDRIEDDNITKIRLRRSTSLSEASLNSSRGILNSSLYTPDRLRRSVSSPAKADKYRNSSQGKDGGNAVCHDKSSLSELNDSVFLKSEIKSSDNTPNRKVLENGEADAHNTQQHLNNAASAVTPESDINKKLTKVTPSLEKFSTRLDTLDEISPIPKTSLKRIIFKRDTLKHKEPKTTNSEQHIPEQITAPEKEIKDVEETCAIDGHIVEEVEVAFSMNFGRDVMKKLEQLYGPVENPVKNADFDIAIDHETAWRLYQCLRRGVDRQRHRHNSQQQIIKDEALARQLQQEQDTSYLTNNTDSRSRNPTPLGGVSVLGTIPEKTFPVKRPAVRPLTEIMQEELALQATMEEHQKLVEMEGGKNALATRVKRRKLYSTFPGIDTTVLDEIFQANGFSLTDTLVSIRSSLGLDVPPQTVMTREAEVEFERQLIEATKQQSLQDMVDAIPPAGREYQDYNVPEYDDYRGEAELHQRLRGECFHKAQDAYRRGLQQVASFYSQQGHVHTQKIKEANMRASEQILQDRNGVLERNNNLDLHGLHVDEAIVALDRILPLKAKERHRSHLTIITGRGSHSRGGVARLRPSVLAYLQRHQYSFNEPQPGAFRVLLRNRVHDR